MVKVTSKLSNVKILDLVYKRLQPRLGDTPLCKRCAVSIHTRNPQKIFNDNLKEEK